MPDDVLQGAKDIASRLGRSERWLRVALARWPEDRRPPVRYDHGGRMYALTAELDAYLRTLPRR